VKTFIENFSSSQKNLTRTFVLCAANVARLLPIGLGALLLTLFNLQGARCAITGALGVHK